MPAIANIVVADATPENHTLIPQTASMANSTWIEASAATYEGNARVTAAMSPPVAQRPTTRSSFKCSFPIEREVDGITAVGDVIIFNVEQVIAKTVSQAEADQVYAMFKNLMASSIVESYFADRLPAY